MRAGKDRDFSFKRALGLSTLLHICLLPLVISILLGGPYTEPAFQADRTTESSVAILTIEHRQAPAAAPAPHRAAPKSEHITVSHRKAARQPPQHPAAVVARHSPAPDAGRANKPTRLAALLHAAAATSEPVATPRSGPTRPAVAGSPAAAVSTAVAATPSPSPLPAATAAAVASLVDPPPGGWGQNFHDPTVFDDEALTALRARLHTSVLAHVEVDENGRATNVTLEGGGLDPDTRADLAARLRTMRYIPAECNGLRCAASFDLKL